MFDSHCHLTDTRFADDQAEVIDRARAAGLTGMVTIASDGADAHVAWKLASQHDDIWSTAGVHPHTAAAATDDDLVRIRQMLARPDVVAVGETGLDYHYDNSPRDVQRRLFEWHLGVAAEVGKGIVVHSRTADDDVAAMIRGAPAVIGVLHCFSGGDALLDTALEAGWYVSFAGMVTFRNFSAAEHVRRVPGDRLLAETDSPYLAPIPHRGRRNEPAFVAETCAALARIRDEDPAATIAATTRNALRFYGVDAA